MRRQLSNAVIHPCVYVSVCYVPYCIGYHIKQTVAYRHAKRACVVRGDASIRKVMNNIRSDVSG